MTVLGRILALATLVLGVAACSSGGGGAGGMISGAVCQLSPVTLGFGVALLDNTLPCNGGGAGPQVVTIQNLGSTTITDTISLIVDPGNPTSAPVFELFSGQSSTFSVAPGGTLDVTLSTFACKTDSNDGVYEGVASFGPDCGTVDLTLTVVEM